jgi:hypothetical protein
MQSVFRYRKLEQTWGTELKQINANEPRNGVKKHAYAVDEPPVDEEHRDNDLKVVGDSCVEILRIAYLFIEKEKLACCAGTGILAESER